MLKIPFLQLVFGFCHVLFGQFEILACSGHIASSLVQFFQTASGLLPGSAGIFEITADRYLNRLAAVRQPQNDEQRQHGGDKAGVGDLPGAAMMTAMAAFFLDDDDGCVGIRTPRDAPERCESLPSAAVKVSNAFARMRRDLQARDSAGSSCEIEQVTEGNGWSEGAYLDGEFKTKSTLASSI